jgi:putative FmdB family regulatory protein
MPTYEYQCKKCHKAYEFFESIMDVPKKTCPDKKCKGRLERLVTGGAGIIFKGSGFYQTDYRSSDYKKQQASESAAPAKTVEKPDSKKTEKTEKTGKSKKAKN